MGHGTADAVPYDVTRAPVAAQGTILGTLQYMAPEQVEGVDTDSRVDLWAFGAILYEMITGKPAFEARTPATLIAAVLTQQPERIRQTQPHVPRGLERLIDGCLEKDREQRWQSIRDVRRQLSSIAAVDEAVAIAATAPSTRRLSRGAAMGVVALVLAVGAATGYFVAGRFGRGTGRPQLVRFEIRPPSGTTIVHFEDTSQFMAPSPDGTRVAFVAGGRLWIKALDRAAAVEVPGGTGVLVAGWSFDCVFRRRAAQEESDRWRTTAGVVPGVVAASERHVEFSGCHSL